VIHDPTAFILANTRLQPVPHAPEISLWLADEVTPIWRLTEEELGEMGLPPPFWAFAWAGGQGLARWLLDNPAEVAGKRVLDFAAGSGLVGIAAMRAGAASVLCADIDPFCGAAVGLNAGANGVVLSFTEADQLDAPPPDVDVLAAAGRGTRVLVGDPLRTWFPKSGFDLLAEYAVPTTRELEDSAVKRTRVWTLTPAR
jgi:predicted nicotinamide N-methyase